MVLRDPLIDSKYQGDYKNGAGSLGTLSIRSVKLRDLQRIGYIAERPRRVTRGSWILKDRSPIMETLRNRSRRLRDPKDYIGGHVVPLA